ncbi:MAG: PilZ domain-containing protein [Candidatus Omnitrophota bacterium]
MANTNENASSKERRIYIRTDTSVAMTVYVKRNGDSEQIQAITKNISATGVMAEIDKDLSLSTEVKLELTPPGSANPVHCGGTVIWSTPLQETGKYQCGILFTAIEEDNKNTFLKFLCDTIYKASGKHS